MDYEKKYKESMAKMSTFLAKHDGFTISKDGEMYKELSEIFPELKESEDERIRKEIIKFLELPHPQFVGKRDHEKWIAWLEQQGKHANFRNNIQVGDKVTRNQDGVLVNLSQLKRVAKPAEVQGEQKPVEPQQDMLSQEKYAKAVDECIYGEQKPADNEMIEILRTEYEKGRADAIEEMQNPAWSEEDEKIYQSIMDDTVQENQLNGKQTDWLRSIKYRYFPQPNQEWSEEDETALGDALWCCKQAASIAKDKNDMGNIWYAENWLKSLKERYAWKPSYEQISIIEFVMEDIEKDSIRYAVLNSILEQLKKLKS